MNPDSSVVQRIGSTIKRTSGSSIPDGNHLKVPGPVPKAKLHRSQNNLAFDFSGEDVRKCFSVTNALIYFLFSMPVIPNSSVHLTLAHPHLTLSKEIIYNVYK